MSASIANLKPESIQGKNVFLRAELNVPLSEPNKEGVRTVTSMSRITAVVPTIKYLRDHGARCIGVFAHLGRPDGQVNPLLSLRPIAPVLSNQLGMNVPFVEHCIGEEVEKAVNVAPPGSVILFENLRFHPGEEADSTDPTTSLQFEVFSSALSLPFQVYVNDAFGSSHRAHASICGVTKFIPVCVAGLTMSKEIAYLKSIENPVRPFAAIVGGAKVSTKIDVLYNLLDHVDHLLIGGAMAFTFYRALGLSVGHSRFEEKYLSTALRIMEAAEHKRVRVTIASDVVVVEAANMEEVIEAAAAGRPLACRTVPFTDIPPNTIGLDIGRTALEEFYDILGGCKTILWNGKELCFEFWVGLLVT